MLNDLKSLRSSARLPIDCLADEKGDAAVHGTEQCACMLLYAKQTALKIKSPFSERVLIDIRAAWACPQDPSGNSQALGGRLRNRAGSNMTVS